MMLYYKYNTQTRQQPTRPSVTSTETKHYTDEVNKCSSE